MSVVNTALEKWERHLQFLSPELVVFSIFDESLGFAERKAMVDKLYSYRHQWRPGQGWLFWTEFAFVTEEVIKEKIYNGGSGHVKTSKLLQVVA